MNEPVKKLTSTIVVPTKDRPDDLVACLDSILIQTRLPEEIIIVDDGEADAAALKQRVAHKAPGVVLRYHRKDGEPGLTASRNIAIRMAQGDVVFFLDDDVVLEPEYVAAMMEIHENDASGEIGGVGGVITNAPVSFGEMLSSLVSLTPRWGHGKVFPCGINQVNYGAVKTVQDVQWLSGGVTSYRREVFERFTFHEGFRGYGSMEDVEFSHRVSKAYRLVATPAARLAHYHTEVQRISRRELTYQRVLNLWYHFHHNMPQRLVNRLAFGWYLFAMALVEFGNMLIRPHRFRRMWGRLSGHVLGIWDCLRGRGPAVRRESEGT